MHIVLLILKILLIVVLSLLGLILLLVLMILYVPVRYKGYVRKQDDIFAKLTARWLGFVLCFKLTYATDEGVDYKLRLFGGTIFGSDNGEESENAIAEDPDGSEADGMDTDEPRVDGSDSDGGHGEHEESFEERYPSADTDDKEFILDDREFSGSQEGIFSRIGRRIDGLVKTGIARVKTLSEKFAGLKKKKDGYTKLVNNVRTKEAIRVVKVQLIALLRHIKPTKVKGQLTYGTGDPASTGQHLGYMSILFPLYSDNIDITPDFAEKHLEGDLYICGRIRLGIVGWYALKVIWNKNVKITIERFKKISGGR